MSKSRWPAALIALVASLSGCGQTDRGDSKSDSQAKNDENGKTRPQPGPADKAVREDVTTTNNPEAAAEIRGLIPSAAGVTNSEWLHRLADSPGKSSDWPFADLANQSLTFALFVARDRQPSSTEHFQRQRDEFHRTTTSVESLEDAVMRSAELDFVSIIQPEYITAFTCQVDGDTAQGRIAFEAPDVYRGQVEYTARRVGQKWNIDQWRLPARSLVLDRREDGRWKASDALGPIVPQRDEDLPRVRVEGQIRVGGKPLPGQATVVFFHEQEFGPGRRAQTAGDGRFAISLPPGKHHVAIVSREAELEQYLDQYAVAESSELTCEIKPKKNPSIDFDLIDPRQVADALRELRAGMTLDEEEKLEALDYHGKLADVALVHLKGQTAVRSINLDDADVGDRGLAHLSDCTGLVNLSLTATKVTDAGLSSLGKMTKLKQLGLSGTKTGDAALATVGKLESLERLELSGTAISSYGLSKIIGLRKLHTLHLTDTKIDDRASAVLTEYKHLNALLLANTKITDEGLGRLAALSELESLDLSGTAVSDKGLAHLKDLKKLKALFLDETQVTDAGLQHLQGLKALEELGLTNTKVTEAGAADLRKALPKLHVER